jgi:Family of unknown function (DUF5906)
MTKTARDAADALREGGPDRVREKIDRDARKIIDDESDSAELPRDVRLEDFVAYLPMHNYIFLPTREPWPAKSVNVRLPPIPMPGWDMPASAWLDANARVEQMTWAPGEPMLIKDRLVSEGGFFPRPGCTVLNLYRPPTLVLGDATAAGPWLDHVKRVYPDDTGHIVSWLAQRVQRPQVKINHALVLGGLQGIGKDSILEPVKRAVGHWNVAEVSPQQLLGRFNGFLKSIILRVSEARDLGEVNRFSFYDHSKSLTAAPPDVLRVDEKNLREHSVLNCCGVVITTNHKTDGIFLPADDRRHYIAWSELTKDDFAADYWAGLWNWYDNGGDGHVAAYLANLVLTDFNVKAPPPKTAAFWTIVDANRAPEDAELADVLDKLGTPDPNNPEEIIRPEATTLIAVQDATSDENFEEWLKDRKNRRQIPYRFEQCGYVPVRNAAADDGLWKIKGRRQVVYAKATLTLREQLAAASRLAGKEQSVLPFGRRSR